MIVGMTGNRIGMSTEQLIGFEQLLLGLDAKWIHHGDCVGSDADAHDIATDMNILTDIHPPTNRSQRAFKDGTIIRAPMPYLVRNRAIVDSSEALIATPREGLRKGDTWYTINYGKKECKPMYIIYPSGKVEKHNV